MGKTTHVWLLNMGGPDKPESVQPFLERLLSDPDLIQIPFAWFQRIFAWVISRTRAKAKIPEYARMGGASPQLEMVAAQTRGLNRLLGEGVHCLPVFRYWGPSADEAAASVGKGDRVILLSLYPQACGATTTSSLKDAHRALSNRRAQILAVESYPTHPLYVEAVAETLRAAIADLPPGTTYEVLFSAHGIPKRRIERGDPYKDETEATIAAVVAVTRLAVPHHLSFQSRVGVTTWLAPSTLDTVAALGAQGVTALVVVPISFTSEHIETLVELDEEVAEAAQAAGIATYVRAATVGTRPTYLRALAELVASARPAQVFD